jgi:hypothetical protein
VTEIVQSGLQAYTELDFMQGRPETLIQADQDPKILVMWPHGDETLGARLGYHIATERPELLHHVDYMCGNPLAAAQQPAIRHTADGTDLNRSFRPKDPNTLSYEEQRAAKVMSLINTIGYDYVLDIHTSTTECDRMLLANHRNGAVDAMVAASPITRTVLMPDHIAGVALIGLVPNSISIEYARPVAEEKGVEECVTMIEGLIAGKSLVRPMEREFYHISDPVPKAEDPGIDLPDFVWFDDPDTGKGYYPVLFGENSYRKDPTKPYIGFAATKRTIAVL